MTTERHYQAVRLDVDGTLVDRNDASNDAHAHAWEDAFAARRCRGSGSRGRASS